MIALKPLVRADAHLLASAEAGLVGARLAGVTYRYLPPAAGPEYVGGGRSGVDADLAAVVLDLGGRSRAITWAMNGEVEGMAVLDGRSYEGLTDASTDAGSRDAWRDHIGTTITSVAASWQDSTESQSACLWALRLDFSTGSVVIALGTLDDDGVEYMPDELVVVSDATLAAAYRPRHARDSAWGRRVAA